MPTTTTTLGDLLDRLESALREERAAQSAVRALPLGERQAAAERLGACKYSTDDALEELGAAVEANR